ncbi:hypothetical protein HDU78_006712 [Chytriomyces hyalinus]|nr:hypothetical protein HDU78_006712 [Chytriomyces hyalinus]KAJ3250334.1 hypothetical protein HDU77_006763 [Chytriomyces hyalinus]
MDPLSLALVILAFGSVSCSVILASRLWVVDVKKAIQPDVEAGTHSDVPKYQPKLSDSTFDIHVVCEPSAPITIPQRAASITPTTMERSNLHLSLYTDQDDRETMFRPAAYAKEPTTPSFASIASIELDSKTDAEHEFSGQFKERISEDSNMGRSTRSFMNGLADLYAEHYEQSARKKRISQEIRSVESYQITVEATVA